MQVTIKARIDSSEVHKGKTFTLVTEPADDGFSHPDRFKVASDQAIGSPGQIVELTLKANGMVRHKNYVDKNTGEQKTFHDANVFWSVVDCQHATLHSVHSDGNSKKTA